MLTAIEIKTTAQGAVPGIQMLLLASEDNLSQSDSSWLQGLQPKSEHKGEK